MNILKRLKKYLTNDEVDIQDRQYVLVASIGILSIGIAVIAGIFIGENLSSLLIAASGIVLFSAFTLICYKKGRLDISAVVTAAILVLVYEPLNFFTSGGIHGGAALWYAFTIVYIALVLKGRWRGIFIIIELISVIAVYFLALCRPELVVSHDEATAFADSLMSLIIASALMCCMIYFQTWLLAREIRRTRAQAIEIEKINKAQNRFFSSISHEIRTPINTIIGLNELILRDESISQKIAEDSINIRSASEMLLSLINDILDMSRIESGKMSIVPATYDQKTMLGEVVRMMRSRAGEKGFKFNVDIDPGLPRKLVGDEMRIRQILINLLNNSVKYTSEGEVRLSVSFEEPGQAGHNSGFNGAVSPEKNEGKEAEVKNISVIYRISDTGMGIRAESLPHLFDAFTREDTDKNKYIEGTGLGLSIVKQLCDLMGGQIDVESEYGSGSAFTVRLKQAVADSAPLGSFDPDKALSTRERPAYKPGFVAPDVCVLIVDDNKFNLLVETRLLQATKVQVTTALSGAECLKLTAEKKYDVIFMDHMMPEMDGIECLHAIREQVDGLNNQTPVIILTANSGQENRELYEREGFDDFLLKPVKGAELEGALMRLLS